MQQERKRILFKCLAGVRVAVLAHMEANSKRFLVRQAHETLDHKHRLLAMPIRELIINRVIRLLHPYAILLDVARADRVEISLAQVMEQRDNSGRFSRIAVRQLLIHIERMLYEPALICTVIARGCRRGKEIALFEPCKQFVDTLAVNVFATEG